MCVSCVVTVWLTGCTCDVAHNAAAGGVHEVAGVGVHAGGDLVGVGGTGAPMMLL
jgi:hypothetical protein